MIVDCSHCKDVTHLRRPNIKTIFTIECLNCKKYFYYVWNAQIKGSKPTEFKPGEINDR